jgi:polar amino acid transport system substrate-binding protein
MKRITVTAVALLLAAVVFTALGAAAPGGNVARMAAPLAKPKKPVKPKLPALPSAVKSRKHWEIGVKCDYPPFGFISVRGQNSGYDVAVARRFASLAFGSNKKVNFTCVTTPSRIPTLMSKRVDIIISTLTFTKARAQVIDFSVPYYGATGRLLVPNNSSISKLSDMSGKTISTTRGSIYDRWLSNCFKNTKVILTDSTSSALLAVQDRRAAGFMFDDAFLVGVAANDPNTKLLSSRFLAIPWGIGIRKGEGDMRAWVNSRVKLMKKRDQFWQIMRRTIPRRFYTTFKKNVPRPTNTLKYPTGADPETICS